MRSFSIFNKNKKKYWVGCTCTCETQGKTWGKGSKRELQAGVTRCYFLTTCMYTHVAQLINPPPPPTNPVDSYVSKL